MLRRFSQIQNKFATYNPKTDLSSIQKQLKIANTAPQVVFATKNMIRDCVIPDSFIFNHAIALQSKFKLGYVTISYLDFLQHSKIDLKTLKPSVRTYNNLIRIFRDFTGNFDKAVQVFNEMRETGVAPDSYTYTSMISVYGKKGMKNDAIKLYQQMSNENIPRNIFTFNSLISMFRILNDHENAVFYFNEMIKEGFQPDQVSFNIMIRMFTATDAEKALYYYDKMITDKVVMKDNSTFISMIYLWLKQDKIEECVEMFKKTVEMGDYSTAVNLKILDYYQKILDKSELSGDVMKMVEQAAKKSGNEQVLSS